MNHLDKMPDAQYLFGAFFVVANRLDTLLEREFKEFGVTTKQWFLSIVLDNLFDEPPTIKEVAREMGSSHQNVKQIALKLEQKGFLTMEKDRKDARSTRLKLTERSMEYWSHLREEGTTFIKTVFKDIPPDQLKVARTVFQNILFNISEMDRKSEEMES